MYQCVTTIIHPTPLYTRTHTHTPPHLVQLSTDPGSGEVGWKTPLCHPSCTLPDWPHCGALSAAERGAGRMNNVMDALLYIIQRQQFTRAEGNVFIMLVMSNLQKCSIYNNIKQRKKEFLTFAKLDFS